MGRSPEQIAGRLRLEGVEHTISHEAIYAYVFSPAGRRLKLHRDLASRKAKRGRRARRTITLDDGGEFHGHERFPLAASFCDPHAPWQRGSVESTNGVIRRSLPRHAALDGDTDEDIEAMVWRLNTTPRECLGFRTPLEAFTNSPGVAPQV